MHSKTKGDIGLLSASLFFAKNGFAIFKEVGDLSPIDLIVEKDGKLYKVQCKAFRLTTGRSAYPFGSPVQDTGTNTVAAI